MFGHILFILDFYKIHLIAIVLFIYITLKFARNVVMQLFSIWLVEIRRPLPKHPKENVIYMYAFPSGYTRQVPNLSPYAIKLETWLRLHGIEYELVEIHKNSNYTIPFILYKGKHYSDSNKIIPMLCKEFGIDGNEGLEDEELAVKRAFFYMLEENTRWTYLLLRYTRQRERFRRVFCVSHNKVINNFLTGFLARGFHRLSLMREIGKLSDEEIGELGKDDIRALSQYLGNKKFFFGDKISEMDCILFGHLSQIAYVTDFPYPQRDILKGEAANIMSLLDRIRDTLWKDWEERVNPEPFY